MAKGIPVIGRAPDKKAKIINVDELGNLKVSQLENKLVALEQKLTDGSQKVTLSGTIPVIYISRLEDRPSATEVEIGQFVILTDEELSTWVSNGVNWVEVL